MHPALAVLHAQQAAWNRGDLDGYLAECAEDVVYVTARGPSFGRGALAAAMVAAYPDRDAMGSLDLEVLRLDALGDPGVDGASACVTLRWSVTRPGGRVGGHALVVLRQIAGVWRMTHDGTVGQTA